MEKLLDIESLISSLSIEEKAALLCGAKPMETKGILEKDIPPLRMTDGPNGVRKVNDSRETGFDIGETLPSTSFPVGATLSCSWNKELFKKIGVFRKHTEHPCTSSGLSPSPPAVGAKWHKWRVLVFTGLALVS